MHWPEIGILFIGLFASVALSWLSWVWDDRQRAMEIRQQVEVYAQALQEGLLYLVNDAQVLAQFYDASDAVHGDEFARFTRPLLQRHPMLHALEWAPRVSGRARDAFEAAAREEGLQDFTIREQVAGQLRRAGARPEYFPVFRVEPLTGNEPALGFDLASEPRRRTALQQACESSRPTASAPVTLVQGTEPQRGLIFFAPLYEHERKAESTAKPCARLRGFAVGVLRLGDLVETVLAQLPNQPLDLILRDTALTGDEGVLHVHPSRTRAADATLPLEALVGDARGHEVAIPVAGRHLVLRGVPADRPGRTVPLLLLILGLTTTTGFTALAWNRRRAAWRLRASEAALRRTSTTLEAALGAMTEAVFISDAQGQVTLFNDAFVTFHRFSDKDTCAKPLSEYAALLDVFLPDGSLVPLEQWAVSRALRGETVTEAEYGLYRKDTGERWVGSYNFAPIRDLEGRIIGSVVTGRDITRRKRLELEWSRYQQIVETAGEMLIFVDRDLRYQLVNPAYAAFHHSTPDQLHGRRIEDVESPEIHACLRPHLEATLAGEHRRFTIRGIDPDGRERWIEAEQRPFLEAGVVAGIVVSLHDLTDIREAQLALEKEREHLEERVAARTDALARSEAKLRTIFDLAPVGISITDPGGHIVDCNLAAETILGLNRKAHLARDFDGPEWRILRPDGSPMPAEEYASVRAMAEQCRVRDVEMGIETPEGVHWILASAVPAPHPDYGVIIVYVDITERRRMEEERRLFQSIVEAADEAIAISEPDGALVYINPAHERLFGRTLEEARRLNYRDYYPPESVVILDRDVAPALARGENWEGELDVFDCRGRRFPLWESAGTVRDAQGRMRYAFGFMHDITERKQIEAARQAAEAALHDTLAEIQRHDAHMTALNRMNHLLLACDTREEAYQIIARAAGRLFDACPGTLAILADKDPTRLRTVAAWGQTGPLSAEFALTQCWALRRGEVHEVVDAATGAQCRHFEQPPAAGYLCLPLNMRGQILGLLHIGAPTFQTEVQRQEWRTLAVAVSEVVKLALSNIELRERLHALALRDPLTGLFNRRHLEDTLPRLLTRAQHQGEPLALAMLDVDHFKGFNDTYGHEAGDAVLRALGALLHDWVRVGDLACRYGGEELILVMPGCPEEVAHARLEGLREAIQALRVSASGQDLPQVAVSIGLAISTESESPCASLLARADAALYQAKADGRNRVVVASASDPPQTDARTIPAASPSNASE